MKATREGDSASWIFRATVVFPEAVPPAIPTTSGADIGHGPYHGPASV
jgi:hypothetical protein